MSDSMKKIDEDRDEYEWLCKRYGEEVRIKKSAAYEAAAVDCYGEHAKSLRERNQARLALAERAQRKFFAGELDAKKGLCPQENDRAYIEGYEAGLDRGRNVVEEQICEECRERSGTVHLTEIIRKVKTETHLCVECARARGKVEAAFVEAPSRGKSTAELRKLTADANDPQRVLHEEYEKLRVELERVAELCHVTDEAHNRTLELLAKARLDLRGRVKEELPDHCHRCDRDCRYAGQDRTGASRCGDCLLKDTQAEVERLRDTGTLSRIASLTLENGELQRQVEVLRDGKYLADEAQKNAWERVEQLREENEEKQGLIVALDKRCRFLRSTVEGLNCASKGGSLHHTEDQWPMCQACSAKRAIRGDQPTLTPCNVHKGFKENCGCA